MIIDIVEIKVHVRQRLIDFNGDVGPNDLADIIEDARKIGLSTIDIARLVPDQDQSINWEQIRKEKEIAVAEKEATEKKSSNAGKLWMMPPSCWIQCSVPALITES